jgi:hypothetical protein
MIESEKGLPEECLWTFTLRRYQGKGVKEARV